MTDVGKRVSSCLRICPATWWASARAGKDFSIDDMILVFYSQDPSSNMAAEPRLASFNLNGWLPRLASVGGRKGSE